MDTIEEIVTLHFVPLMVEPDPEKKKQLRINFAEKIVPEAFGKLEKRLEATGSEGFSVGDKLTIADLKICKHAQIFSCVKSIIFS